MYFHTFFHPHVFSKNTNNVTRNLLLDELILLGAFGSLWCIFDVIHITKMTLRFLVYFIFSNIIII